MNPRVVACAAMLAAVCAIGAAPSATQSDQVSLLLSRARQALGGDGARDGVRSLVVRGSATEGAGHTQSHGEFEVSWELPDRYVRVQRQTQAARVGGASVNIGSPGRSGPVHPEFYTEFRVLGFNGPQLIYRWPLLTARTDLRPSSQDEARRILDQAQREFAPFAFGLFAASFDAAPVAFAAAPGNPNELVATQVGTSVTVRFDPITNLPASFGDIEYGDYREVGGRKVPHLITKHIAGRLKHVLRVEQARFNSEIDPKVFRQDTWAR